MAKNRGARAAEGGGSLNAQPVAGERALLFTPPGGPRTVVVGDLHLGIETEYAFGGVNLPSASAAIVARLEALRSRTQARKLVIAGDLKHSVQTITEQEESEIPAALIALAAAFEKVVLVPGNHDGQTHTLVPRACANIEVSPVGGHMCRGGLLVIHGHAWPDAPLAARARAVAVAHNHTAVALEDALGRVTKEPCWARGRVNPEKWREKTGAASYPEVILLPPFNELCTGVALNLAGTRPIGPLLREGCVDLARCDIYLIDGVWLGKLGALTLTLEPPALRRLTRGISEDL